MGIRRSAALLSTGLLFVLLGTQAKRTYVAWLLRRGDFARLEQVDDGSYFVQAVRASERRRTFEDLPPRALIEWASRRLGPSFPGEELRDLRLLGSDEVALLIRQRLVVLRGADPHLRVAEADCSGLFAGRIEVGRFGTCAEPYLLVCGEGSGECGRLFRWTSGRLVPIPCRDGKGNGIPFHGWMGLRLEDLDGDGVPEVRGLEGKWANCPTCGRESQANEITWRRNGEAYRRWKTWGEDCGRGCETSWTETIP
jgi:hypothetical protein